MGPKGPGGSAGRAPPPIAPGSVSLTWLPGALEPSRVSSGNPVAMNDNQAEVSAPRFFSLWYLYRPRTPSGAWCQA